MKKEISFRRKPKAPKEPKAAKLPMAERDQTDENVGEAV